MELLKVLGPWFLVLGPSLVLDPSLVLGPSVVLGPSEVTAASQTLSVSGRSNATPSIASDGSIVTIAWGASTSAGATDVYLAVSRDAGRTFGPPVRVNDLDGDARLNGEQPPRVTVRGSTVTVVWTTKGATGTRLVQSRSTDGGLTFAKATAVPGGDAAGNRGWENAVADRSGRVYAVWLDHRELAQQDGAVAASHHQHTGGAAQRADADRKPDGVAMAQRSKLYVTSLDGAIAPRPLTGGVCYCCKTALATAADGSIFAAWRHVYPGNIRDIAFTSSRDGGRTFAGPQRVSEDQWVLEGCPDDGPAMAVDGSNRVHIVWPTLITENTAADGDNPEKNSSAEPTIALFYATSSDGRRFTPRKRLPTEGMPHHPQIAIGSDGSLAIAWDEGANGKRRAAITRTSVEAAAAGSPMIRTVVGDAAVYPVVAATAGATVVAWTSGASAASTIQVRRVPAPGE
jgi:hypothetical protein